MCLTSVVGRVGWEVAGSGRVFAYHVQVLTYQKGNSVPQSGLAMYISVMGMSEVPLTPIKKFVKTKGEAHWNTRHLSGPISLISSPGCSFYSLTCLYSPKVTQWLQHLKSSILLPTRCPVYCHTTAKEYRFESAHSGSLLTAPEASQYLAQLETLPAGCFARLPSPSGQTYLGKSTTNSFLSTLTSLHLSVAD